MSITLSAIYCNGYRGHGSHGSARLDVPLEDIMAVAKASGTHEFIQELADGYGTKAGNVL